MITRKEKWLWALSALALAVLFLASSTDLLIKEKETEIYPVSVIIDDTTDDNYVNFRKGMDQAAMELHADVRFITLYSEGDWQQQMELVMREERDGAGALVVAPVDAKEAFSMLTGQRIHVPVVFLNGEVPAGEGTANILFDYYDLGRQTGEAIMRRHGAPQPVCLLGKQRPGAVSRDYLDGILSVLEPAGREIVRYHWEDGPEGSLKAVMDEMAGGLRPAVIAAIDPQSLLKAADLLADDGIGAYSVCGLYGRGTTVSVLNHLDQGRITGLCVTDDFTAGYLSVKTAVDRINHIGQEEALLKGAYIERGDLRRPEYEKLLYPIE